MFPISRLISPRAGPNWRGLCCSSLPISSAAIRAPSSPEDALYLYRQKLREGAAIDSYSALFALKACAPLSRPLAVNQIHGHLFKTGLNLHVYVATVLLNCFFTSSLEGAARLFGEMPERTVVTWNTMISGYAKSGDLAKARQVFDAMPVRDLSSWSAMVAGYMGNGNCEQGFSLFRKMVAVEGVRPDEVALMTLLSGIIDMGRLGLLGKSVHAYVEKNGWPLNVALGTAFVDMYAKSGLLKEATRVFNLMAERNVITWSAMICGLALHGCGHHALSLFNKMKEANVQPNEFTFTGVLNACKYTGLVDLGKEMFNSMVEDYKLEPRIQHYGCMVDLLGRVGLLEEAYEFIKLMKIEPNIVVYSSFLAACKMHGRLDLLDRVLREVLLLAKPDRDGGVYTLISDLYALKMKWGEAERMRNLMVDKNVKKVRGSSLTDTIQPLPCQSCI